MKATRKRYSPEFKLRVALEALQEKETISVLAQRHSIHPNQITQWKKQLKEQLKNFFTSGKSSAKPEEKLADQLYQKIGKLEMELEWLKKSTTAINTRTGWMDRNGWRAAQSEYPVRFMQLRQKQPVLPACSGK